MTALRHFRLAPENFTVIAKHLSRPECIIAERDGSLWISDNRGGATHIDPTGRQSIVGSLTGIPNGIAMEKDGALLIADIGDERVYRLFRDGRAETVLDRLGADRLGAVNFVMVDPQDRIWITVSTRSPSRFEALEKPRADGYVIVIDDRGPRIVADDLFFPNELRLDQDGRFAYIAETTKGRVVRLKVEADLNLRQVGVHGPERLFGGALIDGITFDSAGNLWATEITRNALFAIEPSGSCHCVFEDPSGSLLHFPTSITFGGPDLDIAYIGSAKMDHLLSFRAPVPGVALRHWDFPH